MTATDIERSVASVADDAAGERERSRIVASRRAQVREPGVEQDDARIQTLGAAALERELGGDLLPARALVADQRFVRQLDVVEEDLGEVAVAGEVLDRPDRDAGRLQVDRAAATGRAAGPREFPTSAPARSCSASDRRSSSRSFGP